MASSSTLAASPQTDLKEILFLFRNFSSQPLEPLKSNPCISEKEQIRLDLIKEQIKPAVSLGNEKKRSATSDRSRVKRTKLDGFDNITVKQESVESEPISIPLIKKETEEEIVQERQIEVEPISLTADEILMAEEGQAAAAMLLEIMSDVEEKYNNSP
ncbi:uncharacterized protein LOC112685962 [Sipha flava]|uniref:Uncharacterized protein LOC112685962 n=1 Tax=Sipha flava TaxID=143950 RepID=A0A8B8FTZ1_9HEMI|nr:uncharacterized protein LOC112685962 [Sipha flava]